MMSNPTKTARAVLMSRTLHPLGIPSDVMRNGMIASLLIVAILASAGAGYFIGVSNQQTVTNEQTTTSVSTTTATKYVVLPSSLPYMNEPAVYSSLGYPKLTYNSYSPYSPSEPNYTFTYHTPGVYLHVGNITAPVIGLAQALGLVAKDTRLNSSDFDLASADFDPGDVMNGSVSSDPSWWLFFAESYGGYWLYGECGNGAFSTAVNVDALKGTVSESSASYCAGTTPPIGTSFELKTSSAGALSKVRAASLSGVPAALERNGTITLMEPRIVTFGPSSDNAAFQSPLNASYSGTTKLCWVIQLYSPVPLWGYQGTFAVDAETGELVTGWAQQLYPATPYSYVLGSPIYSSANDLDVSTEAFQISGEVVGTSGSVPVTIPNVLIAKPGSTGTIALNFSSTVDSQVNATFSFFNPLPGFQSLQPKGLPEGVTITTASSLSVPGNGQARMNMVISASQSTPTATYLIGLKATLYDANWTQPGETEVYFFLTLWNGNGQWPAPPNPS